MSVGQSRRLPGWSSTNGSLDWQIPIIALLRDRCATNKADRSIGPTGPDLCGSDLYEFGVYTGGYLRGIATALNRSHVPFKRFWGFDSFAGLPNESSAATRSRFLRRNWRPGSWSSKKALHLTSSWAVQQTLLQAIGDPRVRFVAGWYNESLTSTLAVEREVYPHAHT